MYYKQIDENILTAIGTSSAIGNNQIEISETEYNSLMEVIQSKPIDTLESIYRLSAETNTYEPFARTHDETVDWYVRAVLSKEMELEKVPEDYKEQVKEKAFPESEQDKIEQAYREKLAKEVSEYGYNA